MRRLTIGALAKAAGVPTSTVRYYERLGILRPDKRARGDYRQYGAAALERLRFIRAAAATGLSLTDAAELLDVADGSEPPCDPIRKRMVARFKAITRQLHDIRAVQRKLKAALRNCCVGDDQGLCGAVLNLRGEGASEKNLGCACESGLTLHAGSTSSISGEGDGCRVSRRATPAARPGHQKKR
jgi:MerR family mercuric resistance operon transcriptional regulator